MLEDLGVNCTRNLAGDKKSRATASSKKLEKFSNTASGVFYYYTVKGGGGGGQLIPWYSTMIRYLITEMVQFYECPLDQESCCTMPKTNAQ